VYGDGTGTGKGLLERSFTSIATFAKFRVAPVASQAWNFWENKPCGRLDEHGRDEFPLVSPL
jgi:hypothetical protein